MKIRNIYVLIGFVFYSCNPKDAMFNMMSNIKTYNAIYQNEINEKDTIQMGFKFHKPPIDLVSNKPFEILTKFNNDDTKRYELRSIQFDSTARLEHVELLKYKNKSSSVVLTEHQGVLKEFKMADTTISVYKQTYNRTNNPKENYSEFFTIQHGLILISDKNSDKVLIEYNGKNVENYIDQVIAEIKLDSNFYRTDTTKIFETWLEKY